MVRSAVFPDDLPAIIDLVAAATGPDASYPITEDAGMALMGLDPVAFVADGDGGLAGAAVVRRGARGTVDVELVVADADVAAPLLDAAAGSGPARMWAFDDVVVAAARDQGFVERRRLLHEARPLPAPAPGEPPPGFTIRRFRRGEDEEPFLDLNRAAFADHPDNSVWERSDLDDRLAREWADAEGFLLAEDTGGSAAGACWTKVHRGGVGEIYLVAVHPGHQGRSLGRWLTLAGLEHLHDAAGCDRAILYTDVTNTAARALYDSLGFGVVRRKRLMVRGV